MNDIQPVKNYLIKSILLYFLHAGSPSAIAGLKVGDVLIAVNDINVYESTHQEIIKLMAAGKQHNSQGCKSPYLQAYINTTLWIDSSSWILVLHRHCAAIMTSYYCTKVPSDVIMVIM